MCHTSGESSMQVRTHRSDHYLSLFNYKSTVCCLRIKKIACVCVAYMVTVTCHLQVCLWTGHYLHRRHLWETAHWWRNSGSFDRWCCRNHSSYCCHYSCDLQAELNLFHHIWHLNNHSMISKIFYSWIILQ